MQNLVNDLVNPNMVTCLPKPVALHNKYKSSYLLNFYMMWQQLKSRKTLPVSWKRRRAANFNTNHKRSSRREFDARITSGVNAALECFKCLMIRLLPLLCSGMFFNHNVLHSNNLF